MRDTNRDVRWSPLSSDAIARLRMSESSIAKADRTRAPLCNG